MEKLTIPDKNYEKNRNKLDEANQEELEKSSLEDETDASATTSGTNVTKQSEISFEVSDFTNSRYTMRHDHMGFFLIFNQENFNTNPPKPRPGSSEDAKNLEKSMTSLGFTVKRFLRLYNVLYNVEEGEFCEPLYSTTSEIKSRMKQFTTDQENERMNAFGCAFLSHGGEHGNLLTFDGCINVRYLVEQVNGKKAPLLINKPKLFFFQACRGHEYMEASIGQAVAVNAENVFAFCEENSNLSEIGASLNRRFSEPIRVSWPDAADILCHFATTEGHRSYRSKTHGSWFIKNLTDKIDNYALKHEFYNVLLRVNRGIAEIESQTGKKQAAQIQSQMTKELHFGDYRK